MTRLSIGYQLRQPDETDSTTRIVADYRDAIGEVYFAWPRASSGRAPMGARQGSIDWTAQQTIEEDLVALSHMGVRLNLLLNANCYGPRAVSRSLANEVESLIDHVGSLASPDVVTTTSPFVAHVVKRAYPAISVRASVNMRIGTVEGMRYLADTFDGFCVCRDFNRDVERLQQLRQWADANGKQLTLLANSGCLYACSGQSFHDNLVAHEAEVSCTVNDTDWNPVTCWRYYRADRDWPQWLRSTWVRPEDVQQYDALVSGVKLATRMHANPRLVVDAYATGRSPANLMELMEPSHSLLLQPLVVSGRAFPPDWFARTSTCGRRCGTCSYCDDVLARVLIHESDLLTGGAAPPRRAAARASAATT